MRKIIYIFVIAITFLHLTSKTRASVFEIYDGEGCKRGTVCGSVHSYPPEKHPLIDYIVQAAGKCTIAFTEHSDGFDTEVYKILNHDPSFNQNNEKNWFEKEFTVEQKSTIVPIISRIYDKLQPLAFDQRVQVIGMISPCKISLLLENNSLTLEDQERIIKKVSNGMDAMIERYLLKEKFKKPIKILETPDTFFDKVKGELTDHQKAIAFLKKYTTKALSCCEDELDFPFQQNSIDIWEEFIKNYHKNYPSFYQSESVIASRNKLWIDVLQETLKDKNQDLFIIVGMTHLYGDGNLFDSLSQIGFTTKVVQ